MNSGGAAGREGGGRDDHHDDEGCRSCKSDGVVDRDPVELAAEVASEDTDTWERDDGGDDGDENHLAQYNDDDAAAWGSEGEADSDLSSALLRGVG